MPYAEGQVLGTTQLIYRSSSRFPQNDNTAILRKFHSRFLDEYRYLVPFNWRTARLCAHIGGGVPVASTVVGAG